MVEPSVHYLLAYSSLMMISLSTIINAPRRTALDEILLLEVSESYDVSTWNTILETLVAAMLKSEKLVNMDCRVRLAVAITVVGSHRLEFFEAVFDILKDWEYKKGCWWVIQEELLRHYLIGELYDTVFALNEPTSPTAMNIALSNMADKIRKFDGITHHPILTKRIAILKRELQDVLHRMKFCHNMEAPLDKYVCEYPLHKFSKWFIEWAQGVMGEKEDIAVNLQNKGYKFNYHSILPVSAEVAKEAIADLKSAVSASPSKGNGKKLDDINKSSTKVAEIASKQSLSIVNLEKDVLSLCEHDEILCSSAPPSDKGRSKSEAHNPTKSQVIMPHKKSKSSREFKKDNIAKKINNVQSAASSSKIELYPLQQEKLSCSFSKDVGYCHVDVDDVFEKKLKMATFSSKKNDFPGTIELGKHPREKATRPFTNSHCKIPKLTEANCKLPDPGNTKIQSKSMFNIATNQNISMHPIAIERPFVENKTSTCSRTETSSPYMLTRLLIHKPIAVAKALSCEIWETFSPLSQ